MDIIETLAKRSGLLTIPHLARLLCFNDQTIRQMTKARRIPHLLLAGHIRFNPQTVALWLLASEIGCEPVSLLAGAQPRKQARRYVAGVQEIGRAHV